jgi:hypothetical protein
MKINKNTNEPISSLQPSLRGPFLMREMMEIMKSLARPLLAGPLFPNSHKVKEITKLGNNIWPQQTSSGDEPINPRNY